MRSDVLAYHSLKNQEQMVSGSCDKSQPPSVSSEVLVWITTDNGTADTGCTGRLLILLEHHIGCGLNKSDVGVIDQMWQLNQSCSN